MHITKWINTGLGWIIHFVEGAFTLTGFTH